MRLSKESTKGEEAVKKTIPPIDGKDEGKGKIGEKLATEEEKKQVPPFPKAPKGKESLFSPMSSEGLEGEEPGDFEAVDIRDFCSDMAGAFGEIAHIINPRIRALDAKEKKLISTPFSRIIIKNGWDKICKDELVLMMVLGHVVYVRVKEMKGDSPEKEVKV